jgi:hypothetical protein
MEAGEGISGLMTGSPCSMSVDYCLGGGHIICSCASGNPNWMCR